ncbi:MAG TPA: very short patch repair endonuclease [Planctomycetota bacterium]|nr:very short patch repair endonuclease [Planctomycetota bacterium]
MKAKCRSSHARPRKRQSEYPTDAGTSRRMALVARRDTGPELAVRHIVGSMGVRYRTSNRDLPGSPDLANRRRRWAIFVHGCFWHAHHCSKRTAKPKRNREAWAAKFARNVARDERVVQELRAVDFRTLVIWECETKVSSLLARRVRRFFTRST